MPFTTIPPYNITPTTFVSGGKNLSGTPTDKGICWSLTPNPVYPTSPHKTVSQGGGTIDSSDYVLQANGLTANTKYYVRSFVLSGETPTYGELEYSFFTGVSVGDGIVCTYVDETIPVNGTYIVPPGYEIVSINYNGNNPTTLTGCTSMADVPSGCIDC